MGFPLIPILTAAAGPLIKKLTGGNKTINGLPTQSGLPGVNSGSGTDWLGLATTATGFLEGQGDNAYRQAQLQVQRDQLAQQQKQFEAGQKQTQGQQALSATQMDPLGQQRSRQKMALIEQLMKGASSPTLNVAAGKFEGGMQYTPEMFKSIASYFTPEARSAAEGQFSGAANAASGGQYGTPNLSAMGYGNPTPTTGMPTMPTTPLPQMPGLPQRKRPFEDEEFGGVQY